MALSGKILKGIAGFYYVHDGHSRIFECKAKGAFRKEGIKPLPGDDVLFDIVDEEFLIGNIIEIKPRRNELLRPPVVNVDQAVIVFAIKEPNPSFNLLDRLIAYYKKLSIPALVFFNKTDLSDPDCIASYVDIYKDSGVDINFISVTERMGLDTLISKLKGKTSVLTGPSGVGKSSLINYLFPQAQMETGSLSDKLRRGKNTTRYSELFYLDEDTFVMDTPGFTSFNLEDIEASDLRFYYNEFDPYFEKCRFADCVHIGEKDCAVKDALLKGLINKTRYDNYRMLYAELRAARKY